ncbi:MAG: hypothetical protein QOJ53_103 [Sphingomonadales bacterium]|jgi:uncharacterized metal-binding protein YceD (DUF177 family)|nr:hypothetical protein [Sphingomonadales bacterium]
MSAPEFSRPVRVDTLGEAPSALSIEAGEAERANLARRFGLIGIARLAADLILRRQGAEIAMEGRLAAGVAQACAATGAPLDTAIEAPFALVFRPQPDPAERDEEIELGAAELDVIFYDDAWIDVGEAVAETLLLNLDPYRRAPGAEEALKAAGVTSEEEAGPFAALAGLRDRLGK